VANDFDFSNKIYAQAGITVLQEASDSVKLDGTNGTVNLAAWPINQANEDDNLKAQKRSANAKTLNAFYAFAFIGLPDILLGKLTRAGPSGFFHSYERYRDFSRPMRLGDSLDVVVLADDPHESLAAVFGKPYSRKRPWPDLSTVSTVKP